MVLIRQGVGLTMLDALRFSGLTQGSCQAPELVPNPRAPPKQPEVYVL